MENKTITALFLQSATKHEALTAFNYFDGSWKKLSYRELLGHALAVASHIKRAGVKKGDRVAIVSENRSEWCTAYLGILMAGGIAVPIDAQLSGNEISNLLAHSGAGLVFHSSWTAPNITSHVKKINFDSDDFNGICRTEADNLTHIEHRLNELSEDLSANDTASIIYTSGTTGLPKGVMLTHGNFCSDAAAIISAGILDKADNLLSVLPLHHAYPFMCSFLVPVFLGATITYPAGLKSHELVSAMKETGVTIFVAVPQLVELIRNSIIKKLREKPAAFMLLALLRACGKFRKITGINIGRFIFRQAGNAFGARFRFFACGGARLDPAVMKDLEALGLTVLEGYGLTETAPVVTFNPIKIRKPGSAGRPLPTVELKIVNPSIKGEGEIAIKGPMVMKGYYKNNEATLKAFQDSWFLSGDLGYLDKDEYLFITGRSKEVIVLNSGKNIYPEELEKEYMRIPLIKEICVTGAGIMGICESIHGVVVPDLDYAKEKKIGNISEALKWAINQASLTLPPYMRLKGFSISREPLPRTALGKLKRYRIQEMLQQTAGMKQKYREEDKVLQEDKLAMLVIKILESLSKSQAPVRLSDNLELDLGLDSLQRIELIAAIEKTLGLKLPETFVSEVQTTENIISKIKELQSSVTAATGFKPLWKEILSAEPDDNEKKTAGLRQGSLEWPLSLILSRLLRITLRLFFRLEVKGLTNLPLPPFIIAPNHCSYMDGFVIIAAMPSHIFRILYFQGFQEYFTGRLSRCYARIAHLISIDPEIYLSRALRLSSYVLRRKKVLCIFPEGGRSFNGSMMEFKKGIGILAVEHNIPVVPVFLEGTYEALPRCAKWPRLAKIRLTAGKPAYPEEIACLQRPEGMDIYQFFANVTKERIEALKKDMV